MAPGSSGPGCRANTVDALALVLPPRKGDDHNVKAGEGDEAEGGAEDDPIDPVAGPHGGLPGDGRLMDAGDASVVLEPDLVQVRGPGGVSLGLPRRGQ